MSAREIIASAEVEFMHGVPVHPTLRGADSILAALTAAGYRILAPGEVDAETVERAVEIATAGSMDSETRAYAGYFATAIRSLGRRA